MYRNLLFLLLFILFLFFCLYVNYLVDSLDKEKENK